MKAELTADDVWFLRVLGRHADQHVDGIIVPVGPGVMRQCQERGYANERGVFTERARALATRYLGATGP